MVYKIKNDSIMGSETSLEICDPIVSLLIGLGLNAKEANTLAIKLQSFPPQHRKKLLEDAGLPTEISSTLLLLFEERDEPDRSRFEKMSELETSIKNTQIESVNEERLVEPKKITDKEKMVIAPYKVKEKILDPEHRQLPGYTSPNKYFENREMVEKWLNNTERSFNTMTLEMQKKTMPRYTQLRKLICRDKREMSSSCISCLIGDTIDCPLFNPPKLKRK